MGAGLAAGIAATALGPGSSFFKILIAGGVDGLAIGIAGLLLQLIFPVKKPRPPFAMMHATSRSLDHPEAGNLRILLLQHLSCNEPVNMIFPADDIEAHEFAQQIARYLAENGFRIGEIAPGLSSLPLVRGIGLRENNQVVVGPR